MLFGRARGLNVKYVLYRGNGDFVGKNPIPDFWRRQKSDILPPGVETAGYALLSKNTKGRRVKVCNSARITEVGF